MEEEERDPRESADLFHSVLSLEEDLQERGRLQGVQHGNQIGYAEGYNAGISKGCAAGSEIGLMLGLCESVLALADTFQLKARTLKTVQALADNLRAFPYHDPSYENYVEEFDKLRTKFRHVCALLRISQNPGDSLSF